MRLYTELYGIGFPILGVFDAIRQLMNDRLRRGLYLRCYNANKNTLITYVILPLSIANAFYPFPILL